MKTSRRRAREFALQGLYQWQVSATAVELIEQHLAESKGFDKIDAAFFSELLRGAILQAPAIEQSLAPLLDRPAGELSPVEHAILLLAGFELAQIPAVPYRVVINEAVELAKTFGGTDGHKYVNGVLDKLAAVLRPDEVGSRAQRPAATPAS